jgi:hypothetical protein
MEDADKIEKYDAELSLLFHNMKMDGLSEETMGLIIQENINRMNLKEYCWKHYEEIVE